MKIAILTSGVLPVPAVQGGAVENLIDFCLEYNNKHHIHDITVYSVSHPAIKNHPSLNSTVNHYFFINTSSWFAALRKKIYLHKHGGNEYYHYSIEYFLNQAIKQIKKKDFDIILIENRPGYVLKLKKVTTATIIIHQENDYLNNKIPYYQDIYDASDLIINTSEYITKQVRTINPNDTKCRTVLNGIDINHFKHALPYSRNKLGLKKDDFVIVFSGRLTKEKGILELIQAMVLLKKYDNFKLLIFGASAYGRDKQLTPFIETLINESEPIKERIIFTGFIDYGQMPSYLKMADIAAIPSMWEEPFGLTVVEAMAAGLPLITTRSGGIPEICEGVATLVDRRNVIDNLVTAILDLYNHPDKRVAMAKAALERSSLFDKETYAKNFWTIIDNQ